MKKTNRIGSLLHYWKSAWEEYKTLLSGAELNVIGVTVVR